MSKYNLSKLAPYEFAYLARDLVQKKLGSYFESFAEGPDQGIDFRHFISEDEKVAIIIQVKRISSYSKLKSEMVKEKQKLEELEYEHIKYVLCSSIDLTPKNKSELFSNCQPYFESEEDIIGETDLDNLLSQHKEVLYKYPALYISDIEILSRLIKSGVYYRQEMIEEEIKKLLLTYVFNDSFNKAIDKLKENNSVIISGIPGIGKSTLAKMLVNYLLIKGEVDEVFIIDKDIYDVYDLILKEKRQVFLFDDFLGSNILFEDKLQKYEDKTIINLLNHVKGKNGKIIIFTTREYILQQAKLKYESFCNEALNVSKYIIDMSEYTENIKAEILFKHMYFSEINKDLIEVFIKKKIYYDIIHHSNYNPRLIESITKEMISYKNSIKDIKDLVINHLNNPNAIWDHAFRHQISNTARWLLLLLLSADTPIFYDDLEVLFNSFIKDKNQDNFVFQDSLKELENCFIKINKQSKNLIIDFHNPSIVDFLIQYINENYSLAEEIFRKAIYINQGFLISYIKDDNNINNLKCIFKSVIINNFLQLSSSHIKRVYYKPGKFIYEKLDDDTISKLDTIFFIYNAEENSELVNLLNEQIDFINFKCDNIAKFISLIVHTYKALDINELSLLSNIFKQIEFFHELNSFFELEYIFPESFIEFVDQKKYEISKIIENDLNDYEDDFGYEDTISNLLHIQEITHLDLDYFISNFQEKENNKNIENEIDWENIPKADNKDSLNNQPFIDEMFKELLNKDFTGGNNVHV